MSARPLWHPRAPEGASDHRATMLAASRPCGCSLRQARRRHVFQVYDAGRHREWCSLERRYVADPVPSGSGERLVLQKERDGEAEKGI